MDIIDRRGKVYLVGAGPGDPKLITVRAIECIKEADIICYDNLVNPRVLEYARDGCELRYVGKKCGQHSLTQGDINKLIIEKARSGSVVCRLKGGDPFIFGRGGEEAIELSRAKICFEVVPGITAATGVSAYAGIPLTHREFNSSLVIVTGHESPLNEESRIDWDSVSHIGTLVFYMGVKNLLYIARKLMENGKRQDTPIAIIEQGTFPVQRVVCGSLGNISQKARKAKIVPPSIIIVGDVVNLRDKLSWFERKPLFGKTIVNTRSRKQSSKLSEKLEQLGARVLEFPTIKITEPEDYNALDSAIGKIETFDWLVFTSANGVDAFFTRLLRHKKDARSLLNCKISAIGPATKKKVEERNLLVDFSPEEFTARLMGEGLGKLGDVVHKKILIPSSDLSGEEPGNSLIRAGAEVKKVVAYRTVIEPDVPLDVKKAVREKMIDLVTFTSSSTVRNFVKIMGKDNLAEVLAIAKFASIGPVTTSMAEKLGIKIDIEAEEYTIGGLVEAIMESYK